MTCKPSNMIDVDWSVNGFYVIAVTLENRNEELLIGDLRSFVFFVMMI